MGLDTKIEWADHTFNPWWGCVEVSPACDHCYARSLAKRYGFDVWGKDAPRRFFGDKHWHTPFQWNAAAEREGVRKRVFCGSMCDVMENRTDLDTPRGDLWQVIDSTPWLDWLLLTKRPQEYRNMLPSRWKNDAMPSNVWLGTTIENADFLWRADALKEVQASVHFLSIEPLLGPLPTLSAYLDGIEWVIAGGESGHHARAADPEWFRDVRDQCQAAGVPFLFKQWGEHNDGLVRIGKKAAGRLLDGREWNQFPEAVPA